MDLLKLTARPARHSFAQVRQHRPTDRDAENHIYRMKDGLIAEAWSEVSFHDLLAQISRTKSSAA